MFTDPESVAWLVQHPAPLFLACVDKTQGVLCVYHVMPRFMVWAHEYHPESLELTPGDGDAGDSVQWKDGVSFSLSAPILRATLADLVDDSRLAKLRSVLESWIRLDRDNCDLVRAGLPRFRMPPSYHTNEEPDAATVIEMGSLLADPQSRRRGIVASAESAEWIGGQLMNEGDREGALYAALLVSHIRQRYDNAFVGLPRWWSRLPGSLGNVDYELNRTIGSGGDELWRGIEGAAKVVRSSADLQAYFLDKK